jgi:hypothetical protein
VKSGPFWPFWHGTGQFSGFWACKAGPGVLYSFLKKCKNQNAKRKIKEVAPARRDSAILISDISYLIFP